MSEDGLENATLRFTETPWPLFMKTGPVFERGVCFMRRAGVIFASALQGGIK